MKKVDIYQILFGVLLSLVALYFIFRSAPVQSQSKFHSSIPTLKIGGLNWDQTEVTIADVKIYAAATGFISEAEKNGGGLSYEMGFVKKPGWSWQSPYGVSGNHREPAVHLNQREAESICRFYGKRLPTDEEWTSAAYLEQRDNPPLGFQRGQRYPFPGGETPLVSHCLNGCGNYTGVAPPGALNRGSGHVAVGTTKPGVNGLLDMGGNVWEWTSSQRDGLFITRGASWWYGPERQREKDTEAKQGDLAVVYIGFRCVS